MPTTTAGSLRRRSSPRATTRSSIKGRAYAAVLRASGVPVTYSCYDGTIHAFLTMGGAVDVANRAVADAASALAAAFAG